MAGAVRKPGEFCWINMLTSHPEQAREFFGALLGWTFDEIPGGMGWFIRVGEGRVGGMFDLESPNTPAGAPLGIGVMVRVDDADATVEKSKALGGDARPAFDIGPPGRMAECFSPDGAEFDLWQPNNMPGTDVDPGHAGAPSWFELMTTDPARSAKFYGDLFGWTPQKFEGSEVDYTMFLRDGQGVAGMLGVPADSGYPPPFWGVYFTVEDVDRTAEKAVDLGGQLCIPPRDIPDVGRFCALKSPQGVFFYTIKYSRM